MKLLPGKPAAAIVQRVCHAGRARSAGLAGAIVDQDSMAGELTWQERSAFLAEQERLRQEHRDLDAAIAALHGISGDRLQLQRLKKRKLVLRDRLAFVEDQITPDIIA